MVDPVVEKQVKNYLANPKMFGLIAESFLYWISVGMTRACAAGMCAQEYAESTSNAKIIGDHGHAFGLFQYHKDRADAIKKGCGIDICALPPHSDQLRGAWWELQHVEKKACAHIMAATTAYQAGHDAARYWERPAAKSDWDKRGHIAEMFLAEFDKRKV